MRRLPFALLCLLLAPAVVAQVYKWTDAHGTVHYSETPPPQGTSFKRITTTGAEQPAPAASAGPGPGAASPAATAATATVPNTPENRAKFCSSLKANLALLKGDEGVVLEQGDQSVPLDDIQRRQQIALAEKQYQQYCSQ